MAGTQYAVPGAHSRALVAIDVHDGTEPRQSWVDDHGPLAAGGGRAPGADVDADRTAENDLLQAQKLESIGRLAGGIAHDFNNMLFVVQGYAELLARDLASADPVRLQPAQLLPSVEAISQAANRAALLTAQLLAFSRQQIVTVRVFDLNAAIGRIEPMLTQLIDENVRLELKLDPEAGSIRADPGQIEQVIVNLVVNARDALPRGGTITIETVKVTLDIRRPPEQRRALEARGRPLEARLPPATPRPLEPPSLSATSLRVEAPRPSATARRPATGLPATTRRPLESTDPATAPFVLLSVTDDGVGMDQETRDRIFEPFFTTKEIGKGTGLGLASTYGVVQQAGGHIRVSSRPGRGSAFRLYLPRVDGIDEAPPATPVAAPVGTGTIMLVEDEPVVRDMITQLLERAGYSVLAVADGTKAMAVAVAGPPPDVLITDVLMPNLSGIELAEQMMDRFPRMGVVFLSGYTAETLDLDRVTTRGARYVAKPVSSNKLLEAILEATGLRRTVAQPT